VPEPRHDLLVHLQSCSRKAVPRAIERWLAH
jgi:hypothetical protein